MNTRPVAFGSLSVGDEFFVNKDDEESHFKFTNALSKKMNERGVWVHNVSDEVYVK